MKDILVANFTDISLPVFLCYVALLVTVGGFWWLDDELLKHRWRKYNTSVMVAVYGTPCTIPPRKQ
jgi:hypothetical protein